MDVRLGGNAILDSELHDLKALEPIEVSIEPGANVTEVMLEQPLKA